MSFPKFTNQETIVFPDIDSLEKILEAEEAYDQWIQRAFNDNIPTPRQIYLFRDCIKPWFHTLYQRENSNKNYLIKQYGTYLRGTIIKSSKRKFIEKEYWKNFDNSLFSKIKFYIQISVLIWAETKFETNVLHLGRLMGASYEKKAVKALSKYTKFDSSGKITE